MGEAKVCLWACFLCENCKLFIMPCVAPGQDQMPMFCLVTLQNIWSKYKQICEIPCNIAIFLIRTTNIVHILTTFLYAVNVNYRFHNCLPPRNVSVPRTFCQDKGLKLNPRTLLDQNWCSQSLYATVGASVYTSKCLRVVWCPWLTTLH